MQMTVDWKGDMAFVANCPSGTQLLMDAYPESGGSNQGPTPLEAFVASVATCSAMDVISILLKKRQKVTGYRIEYDGVRPEPGTFPRPYQSITVKHILTGENLDPEAVKRAVELSDEKYCSVMATLREGPKIESLFEIEDAVPA